jgi:hypothetical protein
MTRISVAGMQRNRGLDVVSAGWQIAVPFDTTVVSVAEVHRSRRLTRRRNRSSSPAGTFRKMNSIHNSIARYNRPIHTLHAAVFITSQEYITHKSLSVK